MASETAGGPIPNMDIYQYVFKDMQMYRNHIAMTDTTTGASLTYGELLDNVESVAHGLLELGIGRNSVVAIFSPNSIPFAVIFFAVQRIGGIITTVNHTYTSRELSHQLQDSKAEWVCTPAALLKTTTNAVIGNTNIKNIILTDVTSHPTHITYSKLCGSQADRIPLPSFNPREDVAVIPYSSGTTGTAKGVLVTHRNIVAAVLIMDDLPLGTTAMVYQPMYHIYGMVCIMVRVLARRNHLLVMPKFKPNEFCAAIEKYQVSAMFIVPPTAVFLAKSPIPRKYNVSCLKHLLCGAAPLGKEIENTIMKLYGVPVRQMWGMTETTGVGTRCFDGVKSGSIGRAYMGTEIQIVDPKTNKVCQINGTGEIWYRSPVNMKGYLNNPEASHSTLTEDGWLKTGDIGYIDEQGDVFVIERLKELIKYKGFQVAPAELEQLLLAHNDVLDAAVIGITDDDAGEVPKAFVVRKSECQITAHDIQLYIKEQTAPHKWLRGGIQFVQNIPKSASGKILRRELRQQQTQSKL